MDLQWRSGLIIDPAFGMRLLSSFLLVVKSFAESEFSLTTIESIGNSNTVLSRLTKGIDLALTINKGRRTS